jgi:hypothetical protein
MPMHRTHLALLTTVLFMASGCAFHRTPYKMYEGDRPLAATAVFASHDDKATKHIEARITQVNGKETSCFEVGCPYWVRVLPGDHKFKIRYATNFSLSVGAVTHNFTNLEVDVSNMKAGHVYVARYAERQGRVSVHIEDLGSRPDYGLTLGLEGANKTYYPVKFD